MSLQIKFLLLVGTLLLAVVGSIAAAWWSLRTVHTEVAGPFRSVTTVLGEMGHLKRQVERTAIAIGPDPAATDSAGSLRIGRRGSGDPLVPRRATEQNLVEVEAAARAARAHIETLERNAWYLQRIGVSTWASVRLRLDAALRGAEQWAREGNETARVESHRACFVLHELIEQTELRILDDAGVAVRYSDRLRSTLAWWLGSVFLAAGLTGVLAVALLRRWVQRPVAELRLAAARIAAGDFKHRVAVEGGDEIGQLMAEVNHMAIMVDQYQREAVDRERLAAVGQMVRRIVHNVRNPLAGIRGLAEVTRMDMPERSEGRENMTLVVNTVDTFERWLTDLLESTKPLRLDPRPTELLKWVQGVVQMHLPGARAKGVLIDVRAEDAPESAEIDTRHMDHALAAVLANAIDAAPPQSRVDVVIGPMPTGEGFEVRICDQGRGVPVELRERIFEPHFTTKPHGTGIGLALAQQIMRAHRGQIILEQAPKDGLGASGACFRLWAPLRSEPREEMQVAENSHLSGS